MRHIHNHRTLASLLHDTDTTVIYDQVLIPECRSPLGNHNLIISGFPHLIHGKFHGIRRLRKPGDTRHYIPRGGMFRYVSSANYFGELTEWIGFAIASWSWAGAVFAWWTFANLAPRSASLYRRYQREFGTEFTSLRRKRIIPFIY